VIGSRLGARAAIVHDWFQGYHGSERVVEAMRTGLFAAGHEPDVLAVERTPRRPRPSPRGGAVVAR